MATVRRADNKGCITIPGLAGSQVLIEEVSEHEFRVRRVEAIPTEEARILKTRALAVLQAGLADVVAGRFAEDPRGKESRLDECSE